MQLSQDDFKKFRDWINLNTQEVTWQGRFEKDFEEFWDVFFLDGSTVDKVIQRFEFAQEHVKIGPLCSWFLWLREKFICYCFIYKDLSIYRLSEHSQINESELAFIIRNFFVEKFPHIEEYFNTRLSLGNLTSENINLKFSDIEKEVHIDSQFKGGSSEEIMPSLEVTLYKEWTRLIKELRSGLRDKRVSIKKIREKASFEGKKKFFKELILLFILGGLSIFTVNFVNEWYEKELLSKIGLFELDFFLPNKTLGYKDKVKLKDKVQFNLKELESLENLEKKVDEYSEEEQRLSTESEVVLTSVSALPKDFSAASLEQSEYEELRKGGYRDNKRTGNRKVYRVLMKSVDTQRIATNLNKLLIKYEIGQQGNVRPGTKVPGGVYYNLYVARSHLKEFLSNVMEIGEATLYENRSRGINPPGKNKVFVWIKQI